MCGEGRAEDAWGPRLMKIVIMIVIFVIIITIMIVIIMMMIIIIISQCVGRGEQRMHGDPV